MSRVLAVGLLLLLLLAVYRLMYAGWSRRARRHPSAVVATRPHAAPDAAPDTAPDTTPDTKQAAEPGATVPAAPDLLAVEGVYTSTTSGSSRLDRVTAGGLGSRARATMLVSQDGIRWRRQGCGDAHVPLRDLIAVGRESGMAGKVVAGQRLVVVAWRSGPDRYVTGFLPRYRADGERLVEAIGRLLPARGVDPTLASGPGPAGDAVTHPGSPAQAAAASETAAQITRTDGAQ